MNVLIAYATDEGQTEKISKFMGQALLDEGHQITYHNVKELSGRLSVADFDTVIIAGSVHSGKHQEELDLFVFANSERLNEIPSYLVSVSLAIIFPDSRKDAEKYVETFRESTKWNPKAYLLVAGAMRPGAYAWYEESALLEGDLAGHVNKELKDDQEFTDWDALRKSVTELIKG